MKYIIFLLLLTFQSCYIMTDTDWYGLINNPPQQIISDTCTEYTVIDTPLFCGFFTLMDSIPNQYVFNYHDHVIDLDSLLGQFGQVTTYYNGNKIGGIIKGTANSTFLNTYGIYLYHSKISFYSKGFHLGGALPFDDFYFQLTQNPSAILLTLWNTDYTCPQIEKIFAFLLEDCKAPPKDIYCLTYINQNGCDSQLLQDQLDELQLRGATIHNVTNEELLTRMAELAETK